MRQKALKENSVKFKSPSPFDAFDEFINIQIASDEYTNTASRSAKYTKFYAAIYEFPRADTTRRHDDLYMF